MKIDVKDLEKIKPNIRAHVMTQNPFHGLYKTNIKGYITEQDLIAMRAEMRRKLSWRKR